MRQTVLAPLAAASKINALHLSPEQAVLVLLSLQLHLQLLALHVLGRHIEVLLLLLTQAKAQPGFHTALDWLNNPWTSHLSARLESASIGARKSREDTVFMLAQARP